MSATPVSQNKNLVTEPPDSPLIPHSKQSLLVPIFATLFVITLLLAAFLFYQNQQLKNQLTQTTISPSPETTNEQDLAANWKKYSHTINQISFSYPTDWIIDQRNENESYNATVTLTKNNYVIRIISRADGLGGTISTAPTKSIVIDSQTYYKQYFTFSHDKVIRIDNQPDGIGAISANGLNYIVDLTYPDSEVNSPQESQILTAFDQILSSFKFSEINNDSTSTSNRILRYLSLSLTLPTSWTISEKNVRQAEENSNMEGNTCADYDITSSDKTATLTIESICEFTDGGSSPLPSDSVIVKNSSTGSIVRYFNQGKYIYSTAFLTGDPVHSDPPIVSFKLPENNLLFTRISFISTNTLNLQKQLNTADTIVASIE